MVTVEFSFSNTALGRVICAATWSRWSHVGVVVDDDLYSARIGDGVGFETPAPPERRQRFRVHTTAEEAESIRRALVGQLGKPYDLTGVIAIAIHRDWRSTDSWFCSELIAWAFEKAGRPLLRADHLNRITPGMLALSPLLKPL